MIPLFKVFMSDAVGERVLDTLYSGMVTQGPRVEEFEYQLKRWLDAPRILSLNSGTSALQLAVKLAGGRPDRYVISTPMTCSATNTAIRATGAEIIWADIDPRSGNINPASVENILMERDLFGDVVAIMGVDWSGNPCNWAELRRIADRYGVKLIDDAAHAFGAKYQGQYLGHVADFTCYSFQAIKHLTTVDGGALICRSEDDHKRGKLLRWFGIDRDQPRKDFRCEADVMEPGFKYHMNDVNATIGIHQLPEMEFVVGAHKENARVFDQAFGHYRFETHGFEPITTNPDGETAAWIYTVRVRNRAAFMDYMQRFGIGCSQVHARNDTHTMFSTYRKPLPGVDEFAARQCSIPCGWWLTPSQRQQIINGVLSYVGTQ